MRLSLGLGPMIEEDGAHAMFGPMSFRTMPIRPSSFASIPATFYTFFPMCTLAQRSEMCCHTRTADTTSHGNKQQGQRKDVPITKSSSDQQTDPYKLPRRHLIVLRQLHFHVYKWKDAGLWRSYFGKISSSLCPAIHFVQALDILPLPPGTPSNSLHVQAAEHAGVGPGSI